MLKTLEKWVKFLAFLKVYQNMVTIQRITPNLFGWCLLEINENIIDFNEIPILLCSVNSGFHGLNTYEKLTNHQWNYR